MKHQSYYGEYKKLHAKDIAELRRCIEAHGGEYDWNASEHENECCPIVTVGLDYYVGDVYVKRVWIDKNGHIMVNAVEHDGWADMTFDVENIHFGHIEYITEYIKEILTKHEIELIHGAADDLESACHLTGKRNAEELKMIDEVVHAIDTPDDERDTRQLLIYDEYMRFTDIDYEPKTETL